MADIVINMSSTQPVSRQLKLWNARVGDTVQTYHHHTGRDRVCVGDTEDGGRRSDLPSSYWQRQSLCRGHRGWRAQIRLTIIILAETEFV
ncbi:hypothetical protein RRG08_065439 [Elysia crispata]|uniref:Uncharacterized protein n=1 Tax=Elysia crispata TaxID=231223 RepID=A0AAE1DEU3_9GAST|nr:hypothetical protein RRG08_065439 [Elysia crispata]